MPQLDKKGPESKGSKTGRGLGDCNKKKKVETHVNWPNWFSRRRSGRRQGIWNKARHAENEETE